MTLYSAILHAALEDDTAGPVDSLPEAVARALGHKAALERIDEPGARLPAPDRAMAYVDYDIALIYLCHRLGIEHSFFESVPPPTARRMTEAKLAQRLPALADGLGPQPTNPRQGTERSGRSDRIDQGEQN